MILPLRKIAVTVVCAALAGSTAAAAPTPGPNVAQMISELDAAQKAGAAEVARLREEIAALNARLDALQQKLDAAEEASGQDRELWKAMREEVRGLYVESSSTKEMVEKVGGQVEEGNNALDRFRLAAGILVAVLLVLQTVGIALALRARS